MKDTIYYTKEQLMDCEYCKFPRWLFEVDIQNDGKLLYMLLRDRLSLSIKNEWFDKEGRPYIIYKRESVQRILHIGDKKCTRLFDQLKENDLIIDKSIGQGKANHIYIKMPKYEFYQTRQNNDSENVEKEILDPSKQRRIKNNSSKNEISNVAVDVQRFLKAIAITKARFDEASRTEEYTNKAIQYATDSLNCFGEKQILKINKLTNEAYVDIFMVAYDFANKEGSFLEANNPKKVLSSVIKKHIRNVKEV